MRLIQKGQVTETANPGRTRVAFTLDGRKAVLSVPNPLTSDALKSFQCPSSMPTFVSLPDTGPPPGLPAVPAGSRSTAR